MISRGTLRRLAVVLALGAGLLVTYPAVSGGLLWDIGAACGYICLILFVCLYVFPVRGDGLPHARLLGLSQHKSLGWCVLGTAIAHVAVLLLAEPQSTRYLLPSAPLFMWCGALAVLSVVALVITGLSARARMRRSHTATSRAASPTAVPATPSTNSRAASGAAGLATSRTDAGSRATEPAAPPGADASRATTRAAVPVMSRAGPRAATHTAASASSRATLHVVLASVAIATACAHIVGSSQLLSGTFKPVDVLLLLALPLAWYALRPRLTQHTASGAGRRSLARPVSHIAAVAIVALMPAPVSKQLLLEPVAHPSAIAVSFPHDSHTSVNCVTCHHNYVDHTGTTACIVCHRSARTDLMHSAESTFHTFCRDCHTQLALDSAKHGPTRSCSACHQGIRSNNL